MLQSLSRLETHSLSVEENQVQMCLWVSYPIELDMYSQAHQTHAQNPPYGSSQPPDESSHPTINIQHVKNISYCSDST